VKRHSRPVLCELCSGVPNSFDLQRAPAPADRAKIIEDGWVASRDAPEARR
jgi:hypothetical protein